MNKVFPSFGKSIPARLLFINLLMVALFSLICLAVFFSFAHIKGVLKNGLTRQLDQIVRNGQTERALAQVLSDTTLLFNTFYGDHEGLKTGGESLVKKITLLTVQARDPHLNSSLKAFLEKIQEEIRRCAAVNRNRQAVEALDHQLGGTLEDLANTASNTMLDMTLAGEDTATIEQLVFMIAGYRETPPKMMIRFNRLGLRFFEKPVGEKHPILSLLESLRLRLQILNTADGKISRFGDQLTAHVDAYRDTILRFHRVAAELQVQRQAVDSEKQRLLSILEKMDMTMARTVGDGVNALSERLDRWIVLAVASALLMTLAVLTLSFLQSRAITRSLKQIIGGLSEASGKLTRASGHASHASRQIAADTSEQAGALEQTATALEEMDAMTGQNAENAGQADRIVNRSARVIRKITRSVSRLNGAMGAISGASQETRSIIRTIDAIAFQTRLLALNAAVEAARAGEAGAGFAVVAEEVRHLAMQSAESAKNTATMIQETIGKVAEGDDLVSDFSKIFSGMDADAGQMNRIVSEVAASSTEQARGINQINLAISEMDKGVQRNAASSEALVCTFEEMQLRISHVDGRVRELTALAGTGRTFFET
ncbi:hypothetical protein DENIS_3351 [Desulfonema ishimotonii]|uniref:Methyl-accepting transducer domain-containing protein n=1 Tax=Desulfonema ishimotonii TaxID=45657 RepID=A0A401FZG9_9BACT|nr:methyl-accepting chemotaxis protein [Desulfonema ishimotonii]GBC62379.1 hypothetical protein DENIS_3351 [Desulfonema ishimotonii]